MIFAFRRWLRIASSLLRRTERDEDLDSEVRSFVELTAEENLRAGAEPVRARREAMLALGGVEQVKEAARDVRAGALLEAAARDVRFALRGFAKRPLFLVVAVVALALGIGANTAIFSVVDAVLLRPLPYRDPDRLVVLLHRGEDPVAPANYLDWQSRSRSFESMGAAESWTPNLAGDDRPESIEAIRITPEVLTLLGVPAARGRVFRTEEGRPGRDHEVVLGDGIWKRRFGADPSILGKAISLNGEPYTVIGVMPPAFRFAPFWSTRAQLWAPLAFRPRETSRDGSSLRVFARLKPGVTLGQARKEVEGIAARLEREFPGTNRDVQVRPLKDRVVGQVRPALLVLSAAVGFVLLIACANVAHMLLARAAAREKEVALRAALGAGRGRLIRQFLIESVVLSILGGVASAPLAVWATRALVAASPTGIPGLATVAVDARVISFLAIASLSTGLLFGILPALSATRGDLAGSLRGERGASVGTLRGSFRTTLMASEFALALILLVGAGLMIRSFAALSSVDPGFDPSGVVTMRVSVAGTADAAAGRRAAFFEELVRRVGSLPGARSASAINHLPLAGDRWGWPFTVEGRPRPRPGESPVAVFRVVLPGYFGTMGIPILRGRDVAPSDRLGSRAVVVVNDFFARKHWPGEDPIGKRISVWDSPADTGGDPDAGKVTVVGVVRNVVREEWTAPLEEEMYLPYLQARPYLSGPGPQFAYLTLVLRGEGDASNLIPAVRRVVRSLDPNVPLSEAQTMERVVAQATSDARFHLVLLAAFAAIAVVLAATGIYGVMSYSVSRRTHEIGIRLALGAARASVLRLVVGEGMRVALAGGAAGLAGALLLSRLMTSILYGVKPTDPVTFAAVSLLLAAVALLGCYIPARRATRIDPLTALRHD